MCCPDLLDESRLETICAHARQTFPNECCGMILRSGVRPCENAQDRLHALDPMAFPRRPRHAFAFEARDAIFLAESFDGHNPVLAIYHSHSNGGASFSKADHAAILWNGQIAYPELLHLVIDCRSDGVHGVRLFGVREGVVGVREGVVRFCGTGVSPVEPQAGRLCHKLIER